MRPLEKVELDGVNVSVEASVFIESESSNLALSIVGNSQIAGNVEIHPISEPPEETQFAELRELTGTFIMAPGLSLSFGGNFNALCGAIAGNGIDFYGNADGIINGTILNYSGDEMTLSGNSDLSFNHSGVTEAPAGFAPQFIMIYNQASYTEIFQ